MSRLLVVAMNYAPEPSGTAPFTTRLAEHLAEEHDVTVMAGVPHYPEWRVRSGYRRWRSDRTESGVHVRRLRHAVPRRPTHLSRLRHELTFVARVLTQRVRRPAAVIAVSPPLFGAAAALALGRRFGVPVGVVVQDLYSQGVRELSGHGRGTLADAVARLESRILRSATSVLVIHELFRRRVRTELGVPDERITTVFNWAHIAPSTADRQAVRSRLGWDGRRVTLHAGNMGAKQGLENVVDAARLAAESDPDLLFVLLGGGHQLQVLRERAAGLPNLHFLPSADDREFADTLAAADVLVVNERPGVAEMSVPSKITSYCAAGRPIVAATDPDGATADLIRTAAAGHVVPAGEPHALLAAVRQLADDDAVAAELGANGRRFAQDRLSAQGAMRAYDAWVSQLLQ
ncbi:MAG TPA: glycosyltransferase family 4 protein [Actinomycetales bacterium]|nr:glycosyltransferase family 4 protein [Actinomycetales bacterium]